MVKIKLLRFALHFYYILWRKLLHFALVLHFVSVITFCVSYYILWRNIRVQITHRHRGTLRQDREGASINRVVVQEI